MGIAKSFYRGYNELHQQDFFDLNGEGISNLNLAAMIAKIMGKEALFKMVDFHGSRPGHDLRYALKDTKLWEMGYKYPVSYEASLQRTVMWTLDNQRWLVG